MKTQMKFQKILTLVCIIFAAVSIVYSFFFCSGMLYEIKFYKSDPLIMIKTTMVVVDNESETVYLCPFDKEC